MKKIARKLSLTKETLNDLTLRSAMGGYTNQNDSKDNACTMLPPSDNRGVCAV